MTLTQGAELMPSSSKRKLRLQDYLPYRLSVAANAVSQLIARAYEDEFGLKIPQWRLVAVLADEGPLTPQELCERTLMDKVTVTRAAQELLKSRLVKRRPNASDGRSHRLALTSSGEKLYGEIAPVALEYEAKLLAGIDREQIANLEQQLRQLERAAAELRKR
jgi:DNA-binding MarR family transcriptional regulator